MYVIHAKILSVIAMKGFDRIYTMYDYRKRLYFLVVITIVLLVIGIIIDWESFLVNISSGLLGAALGIWIAVSIAENITERRRLEQWKLIKHIIWQQLIRQVNYLTISYLKFITNVGAFSVLFDDVGEIYDKKIEVANILLETLSIADKNIDKDKVAEVQRNVAFYVNNIKEIELKFMIIPGNDRKIFQLIEELDKKSVEWQKEIIRDRLQPLNPRYLYKNGIEVLMANIQLMQYLRNT